MRTDVIENNQTRPSRVSASTHAASTSGGSNGKASVSVDLLFGDEVEVHSLLIIDQHTFEGESSGTPRSNQHLLCYGVVRCSTMLSLKVKKKALSRQVMH